jgi:hypothetical protein
VSADPAVAGSKGVQARPDLLAEGWTWRFLADENRARVAEETYSEAGFDVRLEPVRPEDVSPSCGSCSSALCRITIAVYTRKSSPETP